MATTILDRMLKQTAPTVPDTESVSDDQPYSEDTSKLVIFTLNDQPFAFFGHFVREILAPTTPFFIPGAPPSLEGVIHLRGEIVSVLHLDVLIGFTATNTGSILLVHNQTMMTGIRVADIIDVLDLPQSQIYPPPETLPNELRPYVSAVASVDGDAVTILNVEQLFSKYLTTDHD
jgi:purine-binding chemotaxis protein CheW